MARPEYSIIIVNYRAWGALHENLKQLTEIQARLGNFEIIVVDNCSNDGNLKPFEGYFPEVHFVLNSGNKGFASGCNLGTQFATTEHFLFLNPDTVANEMALKGLYVHYNLLKPAVLSCLDQPNCQKAVRFFPTPFTLFGIQRSLCHLFKPGSIEARIDLKSEIIEPDWVSGSIVFISRDWFNKVKGWSEDFWLYYEDVDLCKKAKDLNGRVLLLCSGQIQHQHGGASRINIKTTALTKAEVIISRHTYISKHFDEKSKSLGHTQLILNFLTINLLMAILGLILFPIKKARLQSLLFGKLSSYYFQVLRSRKWMSPRAPNYA